MVAEPRRKLFRVEDYDRMVELGILTENDRVELVEGEIIEKAAKGSRHSACATQLNDPFYRVARKRALISIQDPVRINDYSDLEPDLALLRPDNTRYADAYPTAADTLLVVGVSDTTRA
ncbi:MAG: Uma2 family endonuclease, partial [Chloroflexota bacterium]|nr:Uma2 family endonuclease [Chloroflexota bacterium]